MKLAGVWKNLGRGVYESLNKTRIHINGLISLKDGTKKFECDISVFYSCLKICGGNRKRALMLAAELMERGEI